MKSKALKKGIIIATSVVVAAVVVLILVKVINGKGNNHCTESADGRQVK